MCRALRLSNANEEDLRKIFGVITLSLYELLFEQTLCEVGLSHTDPDGEFS